MEPMEDSDNRKPQNLDESSVESLLIIHADAALDSRRTRYRYTAVYSAVITALLATTQIGSKSLSTNVEQSVLLLVLGLATVLSFVGIIINAQSNFWFCYHSVKIEALLDTYGADGRDVLHDVLTYGTPFYSEPSQDTTQLLNIGFWYSVLFVGFFSISFSLLILSFFTYNIYFVMILVIILFLSILLMSTKYTVDKFNQILDSVGENAQDLPDEVGWGDIYNLEDAFPIPSLIKRQ